MSHGDLADPPLGSPATALSGDDHVEETDAGR
jgi:hypothetical protein